VSDQPTEVTISDRCEHGSFTISMGTAGVWYFPGAGRIEADAEDYFVFHEGPDICDCWEYED